MESKLKHLEFIQAAINRMASNSFLLKGWSVTLVSALFALAAKDANIKYVIIAYIPVPIFWILDGYFLSQERAFRSLFDFVRALDEKQIDFSMDKTKFVTGRNTWPNSICSVTLAIFYLCMIGTMMTVMYLLG